MATPHRPRLTEADRAVWASYAVHIRPLPGRVPVAAPPEPVGSAPVRGRPVAAARINAARLSPLTVDTHPGGVDTATWRRFRSGKLAPARVLDLHGHTAQRAFHALMGFLRSAYAEGVRCVEVVTGQGGVLRRELPLWLNLPELRGLVLAAAHPHAANPGAVRLLLRRPR